MPTVLADLHGRPRKDKAPPHEPKPITGDLAEAPEWMNAEQQLAWVYAITHAPPGLLKRIDKGALAVWVIAEDLHRQAVTRQNRMGLLVEAPVTKLPIQSPYLPIINRQGLIMLKAASELGFSPVSRPRVGVMPSLPAAPQGNHAPHVPQRSLEDFLGDHPETTH